MNMRKQPLIYVKGGKPKKKKTNTQKISYCTH